MGKFNVKNTKLKKQVGLYEAESINNAGTITIAVNPKEHFEKTFQVVNTNIPVTSVTKTQSAGLNDKQIFFHDGIVLWPFVHPFLEKVRKEKEKYKNDIQHVIEEKNI